MVLLRDPRGRARSIPAIWRKECRAFLPRRVGRRAGWVWVQVRVSPPDSGASSAQCAHASTQGPEQGTPGGRDPAAPAASLGDRFGGGNPPGRRARGTPPPPEVSFRGLPGGTHGSGRREGNGWKGRPPTPTGVPSTFSPGPGLEGGRNRGTLRLVRDIGWESLRIPERKTAILPTEARSGRTSGTGCS